MTKTREMEAPFAPSLFVEIRKWMEQGVFEVFHEAIIGALESAQPKSKPNPRSQPRPGKGEQSQEQDDNDDPPSGSGGSSQEEEASSHQGKLLLDATVAPQAIRYPE